MACTGGMGRIPGLPYSCYSKPIFSHLELFLGYISHMDTAVNRVHDTLSGAVLRILRALARVLIRHGLPFDAFVDLAKRAYVDVALADFALPNRKPSISRVSVLTGLTRKEVQRLSDPQPEADHEQLARHNRAARVVAGWVRDPDFRTADEPRALTLDGEHGFAGLVRRYSGDVPPRAVLDELLRVGTVDRLDDGTLKLMSRVYIPRSSDLGKLTILGSDVAWLIETIDHNLVHGDDTPRLQRKVMYDNLPAAALPEFRAFAAEHAQQVIELLDHWLSRHDRDSNPRVHGTGRMRAGVGIFYFEENLTPLSREN